MKGNIEKETSKKKLIWQHICIKGGYRAIWGHDLHVILVKPCHWISIKLARAKVAY